MTNYDTEVIGLGKSEVVYVRLTPEQKMILSCISRRMGHSNLSDTLRALIDIGLSVLSDKIKEPCLPRYTHGM